MTGTFRRIPLFLRVTLVIAAAFLALIVAAFLLKIVLFAAILAALALGGLFAFNFVKAFLRVRRERGASITGG